MANWSKRRSTKAGNQGQRTTRTTNSNGKSTYSSSKKVGNTRTTTSISSSCKMKVYMTEQHPTLGTKRTVKTLNKTPPKPKKAKKPKAAKRPRNVARNNVKYDGGDGSWIWIVLGIIVFLWIIG